MKKIIIFLVFISISIKAVAQSSTIAPNYIVIPGVATLPGCTNTDKGKTVFNTTDNKMYFCDGTSWQSMAGVPSAGVGWTQSGVNINNTNSGKVEIGTPSSSTSKLSIVDNRDVLNTPLDAVSVIKNGNGGGIYANASVGYAVKGVSNDGSGISGITNSPNFAAGVSGISNNTGSPGGYFSAPFLASSPALITAFGNVGMGIAAPQEKLHVNGNIKTEEGIYSTSTGGLNMVPLGIINVTYYIDLNANLSNISITNKVGNLATGTYYYGKSFGSNGGNGSDDLTRLEVKINNALLSSYSQVVLVGSPNFQQLWGPYINISEARFVPYGGTYVLVILMGSDDFTGCSVTGDFIIYGLK
jgi:hypothetical protein